MNDCGYAFVSDFFFFVEEYIFTAIFSLDDFFDLQFLPYPEQPGKLLSPLQLPGWCQQQVGDFKVFITGYPPSLHTARLLALRSLRNLYEIFRAEIL